MDTLAATRPAAPAPIGRLARGPVLGLAAAVGVALVATSGRYGYHRDELYFLTAGRDHPAWGYPDQPPLTPLIVGAVGRLAPASLGALRLPSALAAALTVLVAALICAELGGGRRSQLIAAAVTAVSAVTLVTGHFVTTTTFDVLFSTLLCWLVARAIRTGRHRLLVAAGLVLGVGLLNKDLVGILAVALVAAVALVGPRQLLRSPWLYAGAAVAAVLGLPYLLWQAAHGWPQVAMTRVIAGGGDEGGRIGFIPFQLILISPVLVPVWVSGLVRLLRTPREDTPRERSSHPRENTPRESPGHPRGDTSREPPGNPRTRPFRAFGVAYLLLAALYLATGGKAYYLAGAYPALVAAGAVATDGWLSRGATRLRAALLAVAIGLSAVVGAVVGLAVLPADRLGPVLAVNPDAGEMVGWPEFADAVATAWRGLPAAEREHAVIFTGNYGEAGALVRYGPQRGLPSPYSGHNGFGYWGVPPDSATTAVVVGYQTAFLDRFFGRCEAAGQVRNAAGVDNEEQGAPVWVCRGPRRPWSAMWPELRHLS